MDCHCLPTAGPFQLSALLIPSCLYKQFSAHQGQVENRPFGDAEKGQKAKSWRNFIVYVLFITSTPVVLFHNHFKYPTYN